MYVTKVWRNFNHNKNESKKLKDCLVFMLDFMTFENWLEEVDEEWYKKASQFTLQEFWTWCAELVEYHEWLEKNCWKKTKKQ